MCYRDPNGWLLESDRMFCGWRKMLRKSRVRIRRYTLVMRSLSDFVLALCSLNKSYIEEILGRGVVRGCENRVWLTEDWAQA